eukprot:scaffold484193_cov46-Prasinocladus_malaysianus.AAC.1
MTSLPDDLPELLNDLDDFSPTGSQAIPLSKPRYARFANAGNECNKRSSAKKGTTPRWALESPLLAARWIGRCRVVSLTAWCTPG